MPWSHRVPGHYDESDTSVCSGGVGPGGTSTVARFLPDGSIIAMAGDWQQVTIGYQRGDEWWVESFSTVDQQNQSPTLVVGAAGDVLAAWLQVNGALSIVHLLDSTWEELGVGATGFVPHGPTEPVVGVVSLAVDTLGRAIMGWTEDVGVDGTCVYVARLNGDVWEEIEGSASTSGVSIPGSRASGVQIAVSQSDEIFVLWESWPENRLYLRYFDGNSWVDLAGTGAGDGFGANRHDLPSMVIASDGHPMVGSATAIAGTSSQFSYGIVRWTGSSWEELPPVEISYETYNHDLSLTSDRDGNPIVSWISGGYIPGSISETYVKRLENDSWTEVNDSATAGGVSNSDQRTLSLSVTATADRICVAWSENEPGYDPDPSVDTDDGNPPEYRKGGEPRLLVRCSEY